MFSEPWGEKNSAVLLWLWDFRILGDVLQWALPIRSEWSHIITIIKNTFIYPTNFLCTWYIIRVCGLHMCAQPHVDTHSCARMWKSGVSTKYLSRLLSFFSTQGLWMNWSSSARLADHGGAPICLYLPRTGLTGTCLHNFTTGALPDDSFPSPNNNNNIYKPLM